MVDASTPVRVFIGSGEASLLERKTLIYSIRKNTSRPLDIWVINGTHNSIERNNDPPFPAPMSLKLKYRNVTEFSLYRYLIPAMCDYQGRAIYLDSDMVCLGDVGELFDLPLVDVDFLAKKEYGDSMWATSVMLIDCDRWNLDINSVFNDIDNGIYGYSDFTRFDQRFLSVYPHMIGQLDERWNQFDRCDQNTRLIHYTDLLSQPWKFPDHPYGDIWFRYFALARSDGLITSSDIDLALARSYVRQDILRANSPGGVAGRLIRWMVRRFV